jgi:hypothetical protein
MQHLAIQTYLLCQLSGLGGGTSGSAAFLYTFTGNPTGVVTPSQSVALGIDTDTGTLYQWYSSAWH